MLAAGTLAQTSFAAIGVGPAGDRSGDQRHVRAEPRSGGRGPLQPLARHARDAAPVGLPDRSDRRADRACDGTRHVRSLPRRGRASGDVLAAVRAALPRRSGRRKRERRDRAGGDGLVRRLATRPRPRDPAGGSSSRRARRCVRPAAAHRAPRVRVPGLPLPARRDRPERSSSASRARPPSRGGRCRVDTPRSPPLAPVRGRRPLRRGPDGYSQLRRPLPPRRTLAEQGPGRGGARRRPGRRDGDAGRCRPMVGQAADAHRPTRSNRDRDECRSRASSPAC